MGEGRAPNKTTENDGDVEAFLAAVRHPVRRRDARAMLDLMTRVTGQPARMWGTSLVGFGRYHYAYSSGREGDMGAAGFSPRAAAMTVYFADGFDEHGELLGRLGLHSLGKACLYLKDLDDVDLAVLEELVRRSYTRITSEQPFGLRLS